MALALLAEQNLGVLEELNKLKTTIKGSFWEFGQTVVDTVATCFEEKDKNIEKKVTKEMGTQTLETPKNTEVDMKKVEERAKKPLEVKQYKEEDRHHKNIAWIGDLDKALDKEKFEKDTNSKVKLFKAFGIKDDTIDEHAKSFDTVVPEVVETEDVDTLVLQGGSIEITNIDVNQSIMDSKRDIEEEKRGWFSQAEEDSKKLFKLAEDALKRKPSLKIIIIKRLPRYDRSSQDILGIKSEISNFANLVLDQEWSPKNMHIVELNLIQGSNNLRSLIYGSPKYNHVDGIHLRGPGAQRHFTYRAAQAIKQALGYALRPVKNAVETARQFQQDYHATCPQTVYEKAQYRNFKTGDQLSGRKGKFPSTDRPRPYAGYRTYSDAVKQSPTLLGGKIFTNITTQIVNKSNI